MIMAQMSPLASQDSPSGAGAGGGTTGAGGGGGGQQQQSQKRKSPSEDDVVEVSGQLSPAHSVKSNDIQSAFALIEAGDDRRDLVVSHGGLVSLSSNIQNSTVATFATAARLSQPPPTSGTEFQPPYFPPPYSVTQPQLDFQAAAGDPYSHLSNTLSGSTAQQYLPHQLHNNTRNLFKREDDALQHLQANILPVSYAEVSRRTDPTSYVRNRDILAHATHHVIEPQDLMSLHNASALQVLDDGQTSTVDESSLFSSEHNSVIRKGIKQRNNENHKDLMITGMASHADVFCSVPGRLSLLSSTSKYKVTVGEVHRRLSPPECLNASLLGGVLRRAKSKNGGRSLREKLDKIGLNLPAGRRKAANVTLLTSLVEGEALHLARDFGYVCDSEFPAKAVAEYISRNYTDPTVLFKRKQELLEGREIVKEFMELLAQDRSPLCNTRLNPVLPVQIQRHLTHFSLITHGFGSHAITSALTAMVNYINESVKFLDKQIASYQQEAAVSASELNSLGMDTTKKEESKKLSQN